MIKLFFSAGRDVPLSTYFNRLIWWCVLPLTFLAIYLAMDLIRSSRIGIDRDAKNLGSTISLAVDQHLSARLGGLQMLAASPLVDDTRRHRELYQSAQGFYLSFSSHVILADPAGQMLFNTRVDFDLPLPLLPRPAGRSAATVALQTSQPAVGDVVFGPVAQQPVVALAVPVMRKSNATYLLLSPVGTQQFDVYLQAVQMPADWRLTLRDGSGNVISQRGATAQAATDTFAPHRYVFQSALAPWSTEVAVPHIAYQSPLLITASILVGVIFLVTAGSVLGGRWASRRLVRSIRSLANATPLQLAPIRIAEVMQVRTLLDQERLARDLAEHRQVKSSERLQRVFSGAPLPLGIITTDGNVLDVNTRFVSVFGHTLAELPTVAEWWLRACPDPSYRVWVVNSWNASVASAQRHGNDIESAEYRITCKSGDVRILSISGIVLGNEILMTFFDITELRHSEERYKITLNATRDGLWDLNLATQKVFLTPRFYEFTGYLPGEVEPNLDFVKSTFHPDDWPLAMLGSTANLKSLTDVSDFDYRLVTRSGEIRWMECRARVVAWDQDGVPLRMVGVITDIEARKRAQSALRESEEFAKSVLDSVASHIAVVDCSGYILAVNAPWERFARDNSRGPGRAPPQVGIGVNYLDVCHGGRDDARDGSLEAREGIRAVLAGAVNTFTMEYPCHSPTQSRWFTMYATPLGTVDNKGSGIKGAVIVHTDITERRNAEIERKRANALAGRLAVFASAAINYALVLFNVDGDIVEWSQGAQYLTHIHRKLALGRHFASLFTADSADAGHPQALLDQARLMGHVAMEAHIVRADRSTFVGAGTLYWLMEGNESAHYALILNDVTVAQRAEHALLRYQEELAGLARKLLLQEKETTQKLAQALHDELGQTLAALRLIFEARSKVLMQHEGMLPWVEKMERLINTANQQARQVLIDLRPPLLDELGLQAALDNELRQRRHNHEFIDFQMEWHTETPEVRWPGQVEYAAFIVAREAINNALLHAAPQTVTVLVQGDAEHLRMAVRDDGQGIANLASMESTGHLGLIGMRERAIAIGATLHIQSSPDNGTVIGLHWSPST